MRLLMFNLATDVDDPILGFATGWIAVLAKRVEAIHVITMRAGRVRVPGNVQVHSVGKEKGYSEPRRAVEFYRHLFRILQRDDIDVCFSHMIPVFTVLSGPMLRVRGIPIVTWYAHRQVTTTLKLAYHLSTCMVTINEDGYRYHRDKLVAVGHGIDTELFMPSPTSAVADFPPMLLSVARLSPIKDLMTFVHAVHRLRQRGYALRAALLGDAPEQHCRYAERLRREVQRLNLSDIVQFVGTVPQSQVAHWYRQCFAHVNLCPTGALDKATLEAMACGKLSLAANEGFRETMGKYADRLLFKHGDVEDLTTKLAMSLELFPSEREQVGSYLRERVVQLHSLDRLADKLLELFSSLAAKRWWR